MDNWIALAGDAEELHGIPPTILVHLSGELTAHAGDAEELHVVLLTLLSHLIGGMDCSCR